MNRLKYKPDRNTDNEIELVENQILLWFKKFWQFSLFYGDYLAALHSKKPSFRRKDFRF